MDKESHFISLFNNKHIGDDGAVIDDMVYSKDLFCEDIHFKLSWMSLEQIAYKSMIINISDAIVMNAKPLYALIGIKIPSSFSTTQMQSLSKGFLRASKEYNFEIIGGDTVAGDKLDISITIISKSKNPTFRRDLKMEDLVAFTGELGNVKKDLDKLLAGDKIDGNSKFITPKLRADFFYEASKHIHGALDISDGLSKDLSRLSKLNSVGFEFFTPLKEDILCSGEEYEILFTFDRGNLDIIKDIAKKHELDITVFAKVIKGSYESECKENHF
ncbi:MAG TPA: thiamine-phosphate kinase [Campylobacterales bacterium]|nr:thiamine-phosphate kinase [Campylobacterales bacterium]HIP59551.1 thiamine-phosphate kinase [Campylobacterales bacterium]